MLMKGDIEDTHRVETWYIEKGIKDKKVEVLSSELGITGQVSSSSAQIGSTGASSS